MLQMPTNILYEPTLQPLQAHIQAPWGKGTSLSTCFLHQILIRMRAGVVVVSHSFLYLGRFLAEQAAQMCGDPTALVQLRVKKLS